MLSIEPTNKYKIILIGDTNVGKTNFLHRFSQNIFDENLQKTVGIQLTKKTLLINNKVIEMNILDTGGDPKSRPITNFYLQGAIGYFLFYDITNLLTYNSLPRYLEEIRQFSDKNSIIMIIGTKCDMKNERVIFALDAYEFARREKLTFFETSSKLGINISEIFSNFLYQVEKCQKLRNTIEDDRPKAFKTKVFDYFFFLKDKIQRKSDQIQTSISVPDAVDDDADLENPA